MHSFKKLEREREKAFSVTVIVTGRGFWNNEKWRKGERGEKEDAT